MDLLKVLRKEEGKMLAVFGKVEMKLSQIRAAINAMSTNGNKFHRKVSKMRGKHLSAAHKKAIRDGWAKRRKAQAA